MSAIKFRMPTRKLHNIGQILMAISVAVFIAWLGIPHNPRSGTGDSSPKGLELRKVTTVKLEPGQRVTPEQVLLRDDWSALGASLSTGWSLKPQWARLELDNTTPFFREAWLEVMPPRLAHVYLHQRSGQGIWSSDSSGASVPIADRRINLPDIVFPVQLMPHEKRVVLVQIENAATPFNMGFALHDPIAFAGVKVQSSLTDLLLIGATLALGSICLYIGVALRQALHLLLGLRSVLLSAWLLQQVGVLGLLLPSALVATLFAQAVWVAWVILVLTTTFVWVFLAKADALGIPKWAHLGFSLLCGMLVLSAAGGLMGVLPLSTLAIHLGGLGLAATTFTLLLSVWMVWRGQSAANMIVLTSCSSLLINSKVHLVVLRISDSDVLRQVGSPIPILITSAILFVGITVQLLRERQTRQALRWLDYQQTMAQLESKVTERTEALQCARDEALQANAAKSLFMAKISHELRTPMHAVLGYLGLVLRDKPPEAIASRLKVAQHAGKQLVGQIDDLLDYVRAGRDQLRTNTTAFKLPDLVDNVTQRAVLLGDERGNQFHCTQGDGLPTTLLGDSLRIEQVLMVLVSNAMRYTQHGTVTLRIQSNDMAPLTDAASEGAAEGSADVTSDSTSDIDTGNPNTQRQHRLHFSVTDTGRGMSAEALARVFGVFERAGATDSDGLGLGLPIAQHILTLMGSQLEVNSQPGQGSVFGFTLALPASAPTEGTPALEPDTQREIMGYSGPTLHILLLEDDAPSREYLRELLTDVGFGVCAVATVDAAKQAVRERVEAQTPQGLGAAQKGFDLYLIDQHLKDDQSGWDFVKYLRSAPELPDACHAQTVIMQSATQAAPPDNWNPAHSVTQHALKPLNAAQLLDAVGVHLRADWIHSAMPESPAPAFALAADTQPWDQLLKAALQGSVSMLKAWPLQYPALHQAHPALEPIINRLHFARLAQYARDQAKIKA